MNEVGPPLWPLSSIFTPPDPGPLHNLWVAYLSYPHPSLRHQLSCSSQPRSWPHYNLSPYQPEQQDPETEQQDPEPEQQDPEPEQHEPEPEQHDPEPEQNEPEPEQQSETLIERRTWYWTLKNKNAQS